ncbi:6-phosphogluconolactonase [Pollutimonas subterranea]|uniref:6-phosphogluconolactonase n=1 Tax=Pollutimonas subterranea TaxID=2045210 RepID=A0A2N4U8C0_9BURK|nr:6-phosphogluconolactonase [Pollutimonas subterranea]
MRRPELQYDFDDQKDYLNTMVDKVSSVLANAIEHTGCAGLAVSGGRSPVPLFERLSLEALPWEKIHITLVDERFVPPDHPDSNERLVRTHLLKNRARQARFTGLVSHPGDLALCLQDANRQTHAISLAVLGMGDDGHTASLFPEAPQLEQALDTQASHRYVHVSPAHAPHERISMTLAALLASGHLLLAISGPHKRRIAEQAALQATPRLPVSYLISQSGVPLDVYWHP